MCKSFAYLFSEWKNCHQIGSAAINPLFSDDKRRIVDKISSEPYFAQIRVIESHFQN